MCIVQPSYSHIFSQQEKSADWTWSKVKKLFSMLSRVCIPKWMCVHDVFCAMNAPCFSFEQKVIGFQHWTLQARTAIVLLIWLRSAEVYQQEIRLLSMVSLLNSLLDINQIRCQRQRFGSLALTLILWCVVIDNTHLSHILFGQCKSESHILCLQKRALREK